MRDIRLKHLLGRCAGVLLVTSLAVCAGCHAKSKSAAVAPTPPAVDPLKEAIAKVEEDRGEAVGRNAEVVVPDELKHYGDRRKFLAVQAAEESRARFELPHDYSELAQMIRRGELVEMPQLGDDYLLLGAGEAATEDPFAHYDGQTKLDVRLCSTDADFARESDELRRSGQEQVGALTELQHELRTSKDRAARRSLSRRIAYARKSIAVIQDRITLFESIRNNSAARRSLANEAQVLDDLSKDFGGQSYDGSDPASRRQMKMRMLSFVRPEARSMLLEIARKYKDRFNRPLPVTSLVRTEQYQKELSAWNRNAARNASPPHVTGLAFDIMYRFMPAAEQDYLMSIIAKLKADGRVEALRETRDHIHVFAFAGGQRPNEQLVTKLISETKPPRSTRTAMRRTRSKRTA